MLVWEGRIVRLSTALKTLACRLSLVSFTLVGVTAHRYIGVLTLLSVNTTEHERPTYLGMTGISWGLGTVLGPVSIKLSHWLSYRRTALNVLASQIVGGAFADSRVGWRYGFYINRG